MPGSHALATPPSPVVRIATLATVLNAYHPPRCHPPSPLVPESLHSLPLSSTPLSACKATGGTQKVTRPSFIIHLPPLPCLSSGSYFSSSSSGFHALFSLPSLSSYSKRTISNERSRVRAKAHDDHSTA
ncbi:hypothetical protein LIA77_03130 [Sarocladium implicatum]|nr:hypothetical protein LIA77_03130 [Sarocladium implicatum]